MNVLTLEEMAAKLKISPQQLTNWRWKYKNTNEPEAIFVREALQRKPKAKVFFDERTADRYWESLKQN